MTTATPVGQYPSLSTSQYSTYNSGMAPAPYSAQHSVGGVMPESTTGRVVRSVVLNEEVLGSPPEESVKYVEVPYIEEIVRHVPRREVVEIEKRVPKFEYEWTEKVVEVPQIQYVNKTVEVPQVHEVVKHVPRREVVEVPKEIIRHVPKIETKVVEQVVEVPGEIIEVPKPYQVENKVPVAHYYDEQVPMVVAQTMKPVITEGTECVDVDVVEYEPEIIPVDIHVPKAIKTELIHHGVVDQQHQMVTVPPAQYNTMLKMLNPHIADTDSSALPYIQNPNGGVPFLSSSESIGYVAPMPGAQIPGYQHITYHHDNPSLKEVKHRGSRLHHSRSASTSASHSGSPGSRRARHAASSSHSMAVLHPKSKPATTPKKSPGVCAC